MPRCARGSRVFARAVRLAAGRQRRLPVQQVAFEARDESGCGHRHSVGRSEQRRKQRRDAEEGEEADDIGDGGEDDRGGLRRILAEALQRDRNQRTGKARCDHGDHQFIERIVAKTVRAERISPTHFLAGRGRSGPQPPPSTLYKVTWFCTFWACTCTTACCAANSERCASSTSR